MKLVTDEGTEIPLEVLSKLDKSVIIFHETPGLSPAVIQQHADKITAVTGRPVLVFPQGINVSSLQLKEQGVLVIAGTNKVMDEAVKLRIERKVKEMYTANRMTLVGTPTLFVPDGTSINIHEALFLAKQWVNIVQMSTSAMTGVARSEPPENKQEPEKSENVRSEKPEENG